MFVLKWRKQTEMEEYMIEMYQLEQLLAIYNAGTISKAAEEMHISQPGLTRSIQRLEDSLGLQLFDRKKK